MNRKTFLAYSDEIYNSTKGLLRLTKNKDLHWRPAKNCMSIGQVAHHLGEASGIWFKTACANGWQAMSGNDMLPALQDLPTVKNTAAALRALEADRRHMHQAVRKLSEKEFATKQVTAPWMASKTSAELFGLYMLSHMLNHKMQLFQYLKLRGYRVNTMHLYGM